MWPTHEDKLNRDAIMYVARGIALWDGAPSINSKKRIQRKTFVAPRAEQS